MNFFKRLWIPAGIFYYSFVLASFVFEQRELAAVILLSLFFYPFTMLGWLFYSQFQVVRNTYRAWATMSLLVGGGVLLFSLSDSSSSWRDLLAFVRDYVLLWSPGFLLVWHLVRGFMLSCPVCPAVDGLYARRVNDREHLGTENTTTMETSSRTTHYGNHSETVHTTRPVTRWRATYCLYCECAVCHHHWTTTETESGRHE